MDREPDRFSLRVRPLDAVAHMPGDQEVIARHKRDRAAVGETD